MNVTLSVSKLSEQELRKIARNSKDMEELLEISRQVDSDNFRKALSERNNLTKELEEYVLEAKESIVFVNMAKKSNISKQAERKILDSNFVFAHLELARNENASQEALHALIIKYPNWFEWLINNPSTGKDTLRFILDEIKKRSISEILDVEHIRCTLLNLASHGNSSEDILDELAKGKFLEESDSKKNESLLGKIKAVQYELKCRVAKNEKTSEKTLNDLANENLNIFKNWNLIKNILNNPNTHGITWALLFRLTVIQSYNSYNSELIEIFKVIFKKNEEHFKLSHLKTNLEETEKVYTDMSKKSSIPIKEKNINSYSIYEYLILTESADTGIDTLKFILEEIKKLSSKEIRNNNQVMQILCNIGSHDNASEDILDELAKGKFLDEPETKKDEDYYIKKAQHKLKNSVANNKKTSEKTLNYLVQEMFGDLIYMELRTRILNNPNTHGLTLATLLKIAVLDKYQGYNNNEMHEFAIMLTYKCKEYFEQD